LYRSFVLSTNPDLVIALSDTPFTPHPHSQKRLTKSIERSLAWTASLLAPPPTSPSTLADATLANTAVSDSHDPAQAEASPHALNVLVHMAGGASVQARQAFSEGLVEPLSGPELAAVTPYKRLGDGVCGFTFDLVPLRNALLAEQRLRAAPAQTHSGRTPPSKPNKVVVTEHARLLSAERDPGAAVPTSALVPLLRASLLPLAAARDKVRVAHGARGPHEMLRLVLGAGVDLFDARWAQRAADVGVALDFVFPAPASGTDGDEETARRRPAVRAGGKRDLGHNLYSAAYTHDFGRFSAELADAVSASSAPGARPTTVCPCAACSPVSLHADAIRHSRVDEDRIAEAGHPPFDPPFSRAYAHHLLHTHEMSAHALLAAHNLAVLDAFCRGVRRALGPGFAAEVARFEAYYDEGMEVLEEARGAWREVELARGRGRIAREREKAKQEDATVGTAVELG
jgi:hypothetical protein